MVSVEAMLGLTTRFQVSIDGINMGGWARCSGLSVSFNPELWAEGGNYQYRAILPGHIEYPKVTLARPMSSQDSATVQSWLSDRANNWAPAANSGNGGTAEIKLLDAHQNPVASWSLRNVFPDSWVGPDLDAMTFGIAVEKLVLVHEGFL